VRSVLSAAFLVSCLGGCFVDALGLGDGSGGAGGASDSAGAPATTGGGGGQAPGTSTSETATVSTTAASTTATTVAMSSAESSTSTGITAQTCEEQYGTANGYSPCAETPTECHFGTIINYATNCNAVCAAHGGSCIDAYANGTNGCDGGTLGCAYMDFFDLVCVCTHDPI
jgi:hypothetical protein